MQYEYKTLVIPVGFVGLHKEDLDRVDLEDRLAALGSEGWELCSALMEQPLQMEEDGHVLIFKRLVESEFEDSSDEASADEPEEEERIEQEPVEEKPAIQPRAPQVDRRRGRQGKRQRQTQGSRPHAQEAQQEEVPEPAAEAPNRQRPAPQGRTECVECGGQLRKGARFCVYCGTAVEDAAA